VVAVAHRGLNPMIVRTSLPSSIRSFKYVKNHHYIELEDEHGNKIRLIAMSLLKGTCTHCNNDVYVKTRIGAMTCPHCLVASVNWVWGDAQLSFVPEKESAFVSTFPPPPMTAPGIPEPRPVTGDIVDEEDTK
jgi:hypothetical protein